MDSYDVVLIDPIIKQLLNQNQLITYYVQVLMMPYFSEKGILVLLLC